MSRDMKESEIEWIGKMPSDWLVTKLKYTYDITIAGEVIDKTYWNGGNELLYTCQKEPIISNYANFPTRKRTNENDLLLTRNATPYIFIPRLHSIYSNVVQKITLKENFDKRFIRYALICGVNNLNVNGDTIPSWNMGIWNNINLPLIKKQEQTKIADYLDEKCEKIDKIIEKNKKEIELLEELKYTYIDKEIENIERYSTRIRLRFLGIFQNGISAGAEKFGEGQQTFINYGDVYNNILIPEKPIGKVELTKDEVKRFSLKKGDILFTRTSETVEEVGFASACVRDYPDSAFSGFVIRFRPYKTVNMNPDFYKYYFKMKKHRDFFAREMNLVTRASLSQNLLGNIPVIVPNDDVQKAIAIKIDDVFYIINKAINYRQQIIDKLEEYKKSLIYEVVTGKKEI